VPHVLGDRTEIAQDDDREHVHRDVVVIAYRIVRRAETGPHHSRVAHRAAVPAARELIVRVVRARVVMLLDVQHVKHAFERLAHFGREDRRVFRLAVVVRRKPDRIEQRVDLKLFLDDLVVVGKGVRVRIDQDVAGLTFDDAAQRLGDVGIVARKADVRPDGSARIAEPLGSNVSGGDVGGAVELFFTCVRSFVVRRCVERIEFRAEQGWERCLGGGSGTPEVQSRSAGTSAPITKRFSILPLRTISLYHLIRAIETLPHHSIRIGMLAAS